MKKIPVIFALLTIILIASCACTLLVRPLGKNTHFSEQLSQLEDNIRNEKWEDAGESLEGTEMAWKRLKPLLQIEIDHDYVHEMEENFAKLKAYIDTEEQSDALANLLMIKETWEDIESL